LHHTRTLAHFSRGHSSSLLLPIDLNLGPEFTASGAAEEPQGAEEEPQGAAEGNLPLAVAHFSPPSERPTGSHWHDKPLAQCARRQLSAPIPTKREIDFSVLILNPQSSILNAQQPKQPN